MFQKSLIPKGWNISCLIIFLSAQLFIRFFALLIVFATLFVPSLSTFSQKVRRIIDFGGNMCFTSETYWRKNKSKKHCVGFGMWSIFLMKIKWVVNKGVDNLKYYIWDTEEGRKNIYIIFKLMKEDFYAWAYDFLFILCAILREWQIHPKIMGTIQA